MAFQLPPLPYPAYALAPYMSAKTVALHHGKHHSGYVAKLNQLIAGTPYETKGLEEIVRASHAASDAQAIFNNAAQHSNHSKFWRSMKPNGGGSLPDGLERRLIAAFGSIAAFKDEFVAQGVAQFGSGWVWLVEAKGRLKVLRTANAVTPLVDEWKPLLVCDVWEHAYYVDYENRRKEFLQTFLEHLVDWDAVASGSIADPD